MRSCALEASLFKILRNGPLMAIIVYFGVGGAGILGVGHQSRISRS